jgi:hypothetical protein
LGLFWLFLGCFISNTQAQMFGDTCRLEYLEPMSRQVKSFKFILPKTEAALAQVRGFEYAPKKDAKSKYTSATYEPKANGAHEWSYFGDFDSNGSGDNSVLFTLTAQNLLKNYRITRTYDRDDDTEAKEIFGLPVIFSDEKNPTGDKIVFVFAGEDSYFYFLPANAAPYLINFKKDKKIQTKLAAQTPVLLSAWAGNESDLKLSYNKNSIEWTVKGKKRVFKTK